MNKIHVQRSIMRILTFQVKGLRLYKDKTFHMDLYASDRITDGIFTHRLKGNASSLGTLNAIGLVGINAAGKTTDLRILALVLNIAKGSSLSTKTSAIDALVDIMESKIETRIVFEEDKNIYLLDSTLIKNDKPDQETDSPLVFENEKLCKHRGRLTKKELKHVFHDRNSSSNGWITYLTRGLSADGKSKELATDAKRFLPPDRSIAWGLKGVKETRVISELSNNTSVAYFLDAPQPIVGLFDSNIERMQMDEGRLHLKFTSEEEERSLLPFDALNLLSTGTVRGSTMMSMAVMVLKQGGYLLLDEIENSINKQLVFAIIDLFASTATNPNGSVLVFTTHYPELLDHFSRKDNIWVAVRHDGKGFELLHYSDKVGRTELKKSVQFMSGVLQGTTPSAASVNSLRNYVKKTVNVDESR